MNDAIKSPVLLDFFQRHCSLKTYFFQVKKCIYLDCLHHKSLLGDSTINVFPDPVTTEVVGVFHYQPGSNPEEKFLL